MIRVVTIAMTLVCVGCGRSDSSTAPSPLPPNSPFTIAGRVVEIMSGAPVAGARVTATFGSATTSADGTFAVSTSTATTSTARLTVEAPDYLRRELSLRFDAAGRSDLVIDLVGRPPFALPFYEEFARDRLDNRGQLRALAPVMSPRYVLVARYADGGAVPASLIARVRASVADMAQAFSDGRSTPTITEAERAPASGAGQIVVSFTKDPGSPLCAESSVGVETGFVRFYQDVPACRCVDSDEGLAPIIIRHELGHTLGAYHVSDDVALMNAQPRCSAIATSAERFHASILFRRPRGNTSPDSDPPGILAQTIDAVSAACRMSRVR
jgi:hypothetical protein